MHRYMRFHEAYLMMAREARYRPCAPSDGFGHIQLTGEEMRDPERLDREAHAFARKMYEQDNATEFKIYGCSNYTSNRALAFIIEAAHQLCGAADPVARRLLEMAIADIDIATTPRVIRQGTTARSAR